jgi:hypothetical protein
MVASGSMPYVLTPAGNSIPLPDGFLLAGVYEAKASVDGGGYDVIDAGVSINKTYRRFGIRVSENDDLDYEYEYIVHKTESSGRIYINHFVISVTIDMNFQTHSCVPGNVTDISSIVSCQNTTRWYLVHSVWANPGQPLHFSLTEYLASEYGDDAPDPFSDWESLIAERGGSTSHQCHVTLSTSTVTKTLDEVIGYDLVRGRFAEQSAGTFKYFERTAAKALREATPLTFFSSQDAIEEHFAFFESNHVEAIAELSEVLAPVDTVKLIRALPSKAVNGKTVVALALVNILADATLTYNLGIAPTISDAKDIAGNAETFRSRVTSGAVFKANTLHGKYSCEVPAELIGGLEGAYVVVRSTVRMKPMVDSLLPSVLPLKALGLLPSLSSLWDLFPGSFILDWWTDTGTALDIVDNTVIMLAMEVDYCVHSIKVMYPLPDSVYREIGMQNLNAEENPGYSMYLRYVARTMPMFGPTNYPIIAPGVSSYSTAGALAYKILT